MYIVDVCEQTNHSKESDASAASPRLVTTTTELPGQRSDKTRSFAWPQQR